MTTVNTECIWQLTFTYKHLSVTHNLSDGRAYTWQQGSCLSFFSPPKNWQYLSFARYFSGTVQFLVTWAQFSTGQAQVVILPPQIWGIVICQKVLWSSAAASAMFDPNAKLPRSVKQEEVFLMLSGRSQSSWIQLSVLTSQLTSSNHSCVKTGSLFIRNLASESYFTSDITPLLCAKLVTALSHLLFTFIVHSGEFIFPRIFFAASLLENHWFPVLSAVGAAGLFPHRPWQEHKYRKAAK